MYLLICLFAAKADKPWPAVRSPTVDYADGAEDPVGQRSRSKSLGAGPAACNVEVLGQLLCNAMAAPALSPLVPWSKQRSVTFDNTHVLPYYDAPTAYYSAPTACPTATSHSG